MSAVVVGFVLIFGLICGVGAAVSIFIFSLICVVDAVRFDGAGIYGFSDLIGQEYKEIEGRINI